MVQEPRAVLRSVGKSGLKNLQDYLEYRVQSASRTLESTDGNDIYRSQGAVKELRRLLAEIKVIMEK